MVKKKAAPKPAKVQTFPALVSTWKVKRLNEGRGRPNLATEGSLYLKNTSCEMDVVYNTRSGPMVLMQLESGEPIEVPVAALKAFLAMYDEDVAALLKQRKAAARGVKARS